MSTQLLFALPMSSMQRRQWPRRRNWASALMVYAGLAVLLLTEGAVPLADQPYRPRIVLAAICAAALIVVLILLSRHWSERLAAC